jgi:hypothetical protein
LKIIFLVEVLISCCFVSCQITLIGFLQSSVSKYGEKKVANSIYELAQKSLYDLMWMLAGDLEPWLILDLYKAYAVSMSDPAVLKVYERFKAGNVNRTIVPEVFALDKKYNEFEWWRRVRTRMLENVDKYIAGNLKVSGTPPNIQFGSDGKPIIGALPIFAQALAPVAQSQPQPARATTTEDPDDPDEEDGEDSDNFEAADLFESLLSR